MPALVELYWGIVDVCSECFPTYEDCPFYVKGMCHVADESFNPLLK